MFLSASYTFYCHAEFDLELPFDKCSVICNDTILLLTRIAFVSCMLPVSSCYTAKIICNLVRDQLVSDQSRNLSHHVPTPSYTSNHMDSLNVLKGRFFLGKGIT